MPAVEEMAFLDPGVSDGGVGGIEDVEPSIKSLLDNFNPVKNNLLEILKHDTREDDTGYNDDLARFFEQSDVPLFIPPQIFLQSDKPTNYMFRDPIVNKKDVSLIRYSESLKYDPFIHCDEKREVIFHW